VQNVRRRGEGYVSEAGSVSSAKTNWEESAHLKGFRDFITRGNLIDLAVAVVIGTAFTAIVTAIVKDFITPLIGAFFGGKNNSFENLTFTVHGSKFAYGDLINAVVSFLIIAAVVYFLIVAPMAKLVLRLHGVKEATERDCPECLSSIPIAARRCKYCTVELASLTPDRAHHAYESGLGPGPGRPEPRRSWGGSSMRSSTPPGQSPTGSW
jgi:large conductance mechanosensitive channel